MELYGHSYMDGDAAANAYARQVEEQEMTYGIRQPDYGRQLYGSPAEQSWSDPLDAARFAAPYIDKRGNVW